MPIEPKTAVINPGKLEGLQDKRSSDSVPSADHRSPRPPSSADLPPVSRLLDELKHFDREKNLRKVKIEISLESGGGWEQGRRLSESSLEVTEAARHVGENFKYGPDH